MNTLSITEIQKTDDRTLYEYCQYIGRQARIWKNHFIALLPEIAKRGLHTKHGFATIVEFAAKVGGVGKKTVQTIFQVEKLVNDKPALKKLVTDVGVNKVRIVATIATKENQNFLAQKVKELSKNALEVWAREVRENTSPQGQTAPGRSRREQVSFGLDKAVAFKLRLFRHKLEKEKKTALEWNDVIDELLRRAQKNN